MQHGTVTIQSCRHPLGNNICYKLGCTVEKTLQADIKSFPMVVIYTKIKHQSNAIAQSMNSVVF